MATYAETPQAPQQLMMGSGPAGSPMENSKFNLPEPYSWQEGRMWEIVGDDSQSLLVVLNPNQRVMCEPGGMLSTNQNIQPEIDTGGFGLACQRCCCAQESCFRTHYLNNSQGIKHVSVIPSYPAKIIHIDMDQYPNGLSLNKGSWMATIGTDAEFGVECAPSVVAACCAGQGCCITTFKGKGSSFINAGGTVMIRHLGAGESVTVDTLGLVAWENGVKLDAKCTGDCLMMCCGGSGMYNTELTGPGLVVVQSMSRERAAWAYSSAIAG
mmetsp:Transcript_3971/g.6236  ORF Transcript_3971/g.6236 Transcript_3971/m.6236 type:complete len:269 (+) Transcript_3971:127-933(+)